MRVSQILKSSMNGPMNRKTNSPIIITTSFRDHGAYIIRHFTEKLNVFKLPPSSAKVIMAVDDLLS